MSESDTMFHERDRRCAAVRLMLSTDPSYDNRTIASTLKMLIWIATNNRDVPRVMKIKFPSTVMVFDVGHIMPPRSLLKSHHQSVPRCAEECGDPLVQSGSRWQTLGVAVARCRTKSPKRPRLGFRRSATTLYPCLTGLPPPPT